MYFDCILNELPQKSSVRVIILQTKTVQDLTDTQYIFAFQD
uniref:Uncharacterized protein n=1 Tax=Exiguobacterium sp. S3-2 TaxID=1389960 RepID=V9Z7P2_9BACL|nr:hypothetical protein [Exiguobacterium sp. S3-2]